MNATNLDASESGSKKPISPALRLRDERLESLKVLAGQIGHDFNNTISPLLGYVSMIREEAGAGTNIQTYATALEGVVRKVGKNMENLLLATRPQRRFHPDLFDLHEILGEALEEWKNTVPPKDHIQVEREISPCRLWGDRLQWRCVCLHLLNNAALAMMKGGALLVSLKQVLLSPEESDNLGLTCSQAHLLTIKDNGTGMNEPVLAQAFNPFFTTRPRSQGQGLGLTLVHSVVHLHHGQVIVESSPDQGTLVKIWIPPGMN